MKKAVSHSLKEDSNREDKAMKILALAVIAAAIGFTVIDDMIKMNSQTHYEPEDIQAVIDDQEFWDIYEDAGEAFK